MRPKVDEFKALLTPVAMPGIWIPVCDGAAKLVWLITLNASTRTSSRKLSFRLKMRSTEASKDSVPGVMATSRPSVPKVPFAFCAKAAGLMYCRAGPQLEL